ncbi:SIR2 family protein [Halomonas alkaliantarctica]|uniref:SIR2 family protein n=1 Tax=Halomonas alkaliantarctica TaxID=232346 RepID=A0ABY8LVF8_9GAMM|nr:SIR2 family protein [Halomonas alkaliantarctica]WGI27303.1 SIR2 family protein [Halomonas alkaliantarctica]
MRFYADGPSIPDILLTRCDAGRVVFLCGAGVSKPSGMPDFVGLTQHVIEFFDPPNDSSIMTAFQPWLDAPSGPNVPLDQIFNLLHQEYGRDEVNALVTERLHVSPSGGEVGREHALIKRISTNESGVPQIVTTNFDLMFETGASGDKLARHVPPVFPDLAIGMTIEGITYLHGRLVDTGSDHHPYVLSSADFGRGYLSEGWATNFIRSLLGRYTVVLVGYQAEDPPIKYLLQGLNHDGQFDRSRLYAFDRGLPEEIEAKWRDRGVSAIAYADHADLWKTLEAWADRADDPRQWRSSVIMSSREDPKVMSAHERGQVAHVLRTVQGAKLFSLADPMPDPEWLCVIDGNVRSAKPSKGYGQEAETFDPRANYGLDDDLEHISEDKQRQGVSNDNLLVWRDGDDNPHDGHRLAGRQAEGHETTPIRLGHFITWISKAIDSPVLAWWAIRQSGLHPRLLLQIEWQMKRLESLHGRARHIWNLVLEHHRDPRSRQWDGSWFDLKKRVAKEGWTASVLRDFRRVATPRVDIRPLLGLGQSKPPLGPWDDVRLSDLGQFEVKFLDRHNVDLAVPDEVLPQVFAILEEQLTNASGLLADIETVYFQTPTCYPDREVDGREHVTKPAEVMAWFVELLDRLSETRPDLVQAHATIWPESDQYFFRKLKLYAYSKKSVFEADQVAQAILSFDQSAFWDINVARELLFLLVDRWLEFSQESQDRLIDRMLEGPEQRSHLSDEEFPELRDEFAARYARYLQLEGCAFAADRSERLDAIIQGVSEWSDGWATSTVTERGSHVGFVGTDENPEAVLDLPVNEIVGRAKDDLERDFGSFTDKRPFTGLVKANPCKALSALTVAGKDGDYPQAFWSSMVNELPEDISPRLQRVFLHRLTRLPDPVVAKLGHTLGRWIETNLVAILEFDDKLGWAVFDHVVDGILSGGADAAENGLGEMRIRGEVVERSRRTHEHAINGPLGMCAEALYRVVLGEKQEADSLMPEHIKGRLERLFAEPGEGSDHAVSVTMSRLDWLMFVDPEWTRDRLVPMLAFDHPASEPAWNGFLHSNQALWPPLAEVIKPLLFELLPWIEGFSWGRELSKVVTQWLGLMRVFHPDEPTGLSRKEMRSVLRAMSDGTRNQFVSWLGLVGQHNENGWAELVIPFINEDWPRERRYRTSASVQAWVGLLDDTGDSFPVVYDAVKKFLVPVETNGHPFYRFTREINDEEPITVRYPEATLDLMDRVTPQALARPSCELPEVLALIAEADHKLTSDERYLRLVDLVERC